MTDDHQRDQVIQELYDAALGSPDRPMATAGAYKLLAEWDGGLRDGRFLALLDAYLDLMHQMRFSSGHLTGYEADRWIEVHGDLRSSFDHISDVAVPSRDAAPSASDLQPGQCKRIALTGPLPR